jgi:nitrogen-specific signal transduction histidine kinase
MAQIYFHDDYEQHYKILSTASHEIMNYAATMGSTYQFLDTKYPEAHDFKFWGNLGASIEHLCGFMKQASICRYCHFPRKDKFCVNEILALVHESLAECGYPDIEENLNITVADNVPNIFCDPDNVTAAICQIIVNAYEASVTGNTSFDCNAIANTETHKNISANLFQNIEVKITSDGAHVTIAVTNAGSLPAKYSCEQLAEAFFSTKSNHAGCGLYIANIVCSNHGGWLSMESDGTSTTVSLVLSIKP